MSTATTAEVVYPRWTAGLRPLLLLVGIAAAVAAGAAPAAVLAQESAADDAHGSLADSLGQVERNVILDALRAGTSTRREIAERLGISPRTLRYKLARLRAAGVDVPAV